MTVTVTQKAAVRYTDVTLRGGRITKWKGQAASYSPQLGTIIAGVSGTALATALALAASSLIPAAALAGDCVNVGPGEFECSGPAATGVDTQQTITQAGPVTVETTAGFGIDTYSFSAISITGDGDTVFTDLNESSIRGVFDGIVIRNDGDGVTNVSANGSVTGRFDNGVLARNTSAATDMTIDVDTAIGANFGINAQNSGTGDLTVTSSGEARAIGRTVVSQSTYFLPGEAGINAFNSTNGRDVIIDANDSYGGNDGIDASNYGTGSLLITSRGTTQGVNGAGIDATNGFYGTSLTIQSNVAIGGRTGIDADNNGSGALEITTTGSSSGNANGTFGYGIRAQNSSNGTDLIIDAAATTGGRTGIDARNFGSGILSVTASGLATGNEGYGIQVNSSIGGDGATLVAGETKGGNSGIRADNFGGGVLSVTATGTATGTRQYGIQAANSYRGSDITIVAAGTTGGNSGIRADNNGTGALSITSSGTASGTNSYGIQGSNSFRGTDLTIEAAATSGGNSGIRADNNGTGALTITATGNATGTRNYGIEAENSSRGTDLTINAAATTGGNAGIDADNRGTGALTIIATGTANGHA